MSVFSETAKNTMLDALTVNQVQLHNGDPGAAGNANRVGGANGEAAVTLAAASSGTRNPSAAVEFTGLDADQSVTWISWWNTTGPVFQGKAQVTSGDVAANAAGEWTLTTASSLNINDPV
jgi:hypothetical protein